MNTPITLYPVHNTVEAMQFTGTGESAWAIAKWLQESTKGKRAEPHLTLSYTESLYGPSEFSFSTGTDTYELSYRDWVIKDGDLFSVVRGQDLPYRYVNGIDKIKLEAGMS